MRSHRLLFKPQGRAGKGRAGLLQALREAGAARRLHSSTSVAQAGCCWLEAAGSDRKGRAGLLEALLHPEDSFKALMPHILGLGAHQVVTETKSSGADGERKRKEFRRARACVCSADMLLATARLYTCPLGIVGVRVLGLVSQSCASQGKDLTPARTKVNARFRHRYIAHCVILHATS